MYIDFISFFESIHCFREDEPSEYLDYLNSYTKNAQGKLSKCCCSLISGLLVSAKITSIFNFKSNTLYILVNHYSSFVVQYCTGSNLQLLTLFIFFSLILTNFLVLPVIVKIPVKKCKPKFSFIFYNNALYMFS